MAKRPDTFRGNDLTSPLNRIAAGFVAFAQNVRSYIMGGFQLRNPLSSAIISVAGVINSLARLNDTTPDGPAGGFTYILATAGGNLYVGSNQYVTGLSGNPVSILPFRPNASVQPWAYIADNSLNALLQTKFALNGTATAFECFGQIKVRSDGLVYKTGIHEPPLAPTVTTESTGVTTTGTIQATAIPWTNYQGQNPNFDYGENNGPPNPGTPNPTDGTAPFIVDCANATTITITALSGTATINGAAKTPTSAGPAPAGTNPGGYAQTPGSATPPGSVSVVVGAFTDGSGNVIAAGVAPKYVPSVVDIGGDFASSTTIQVPYGAAALQIGINSTGDTFNANSGSFTISVTVTTAALPPYAGIVGNLTLAYFGDSPSSGAVGTYLWKSPSDPGGGIPRTVSGANGTTTGNSFIFDATFTAGIPSLPGTGTENLAMQWYSLSPESAAIGSAPVFPAPLTTTYPTQTIFANFNFCLYGKIYIPAAGQYTIVLTTHDDCILGLQDAVVISSTLSGSGEAGFVGLSNAGQTISVAMGYPLVPTQRYTSGNNGNYAQTTLVVAYAAAGTYGIEADFDYWTRTGRILLLEMSPTPGGSPTILPPLTNAVRTSVSYAGVYRSSLTGAQSNPSPTTTPQTTPVLSNTVSLPYSPDPQVDKCDYYRQDAGLPNYTYVGTGPNTNPPTPITDALTDLEAADNQELVYTNYEPVPSIDLPQSGHCTVSGGVITTLDTPFNVRWLPGTIILIGYPTQLPYVFISRPTSTTTLTIPGVPDGTDQVWNIAEPILANQPLPYMFGPTDNINYAFQVGDPLRPGTIYWSSGNNLDAWPDTNQADLTDPSEALVNGAMAGGYAVVFTIKRGFVYTANFFNALATVTGTSGSTWTQQATTIPRGLFIPRCVAVEGGGNIFFRVNDGIHFSRQGAGSESITDDTLYPLFQHENSAPPAAITRGGVTIYPPDDSQPNKQQFQVVGAYLYYDHIGTDGGYHTWVLDIRTLSWIWDSYSVGPPTVHAENSGESQQGTLVGCADGTLRLMQAGASEVVSGNVVTGAIGGLGWMTAYELTVEYSAAAPVNVSFIAADAGNGSYAPQPIVLPSTAGQVTKFTSKVSPSKWKLLQAQFTWTDPEAEIYLAGTGLSVKPWGSDALFVFEPFFGNSGGKGPQE